MLMKSISKKVETKASNALMVPRYSIHIKELESNSPLLSNQTPLEDKKAKGQLFKGSKKITRSQYRKTARESSGTRVNKEASEFYEKVKKSLTMQEPEMPSMRKTQCDSGEVRFLVDLTKFSSC